MTFANAIVFVVDDDASVREALGSLIESMALRVEHFERAEEFLGRHPRDGPSCLVLDVRMPGSGALDLQRILTHAQQHTPIVFVSAHADTQTAVRAMKAGAVDFLVKPFLKEDLLDAILLGLGRDQAAKARQAEFLLIRAKFARLTARQYQIMMLVVEGKLNKQIAAQLGLSQNTVKIHRHRIMKTLGASRVADLVHMADRLG